MINATQMAKSFGKLPADWLKTSQTKDFIATYSDMKKIISADLVRVTKGGSGEQGTWMHEDVALEFARWLSPAFAIWCNDRIKELMKFGMTATQPTLEAMLDNPDLVIGLATKLKQQREENQRLVAENQQKQALISQQNEKIEKDAPKVDYFEKFMTAEHGDTNAGIREVVKQAHIKSEKRFIGWMIQKQVLFRQKKDNRLQPYADYAKCFDYKDVHDTNNDWSGKHLKFNPYGKLHIVKKYHEQHPEEFEDTKDLFNQ
jgi:phage antirepressor YoqD-like protein